MRVTLPHQLGPHAHALWRPHATRHTAEASMSSPRLPATACVGSLHAIRCMASILSTAIHDFTSGTLPFPVSTLAVMECASVLCLQYAFAYVLRCRMCGTVHSARYTRYYVNKHKATYSHTPSSWYAPPPVYLLIQYTLYKYPTSFTYSMVSKSYL